MDSVELGLLQALQIDGRVAFSRVAEVLGVSDQTVARRYQALRAAGTVHVVGLTLAEAVGEETWLVRVGCAPGTADRLAQVLAARPETSWVHVASGGAEIGCMVRTPAEAATSSVLARLPRTSPVTRVSAHCVVHVFFGGPTSPLTKAGPLTPDQVERLRPAEAATASPDEPVELTDGDRALLAELGRDGRIGFRELAKATGCSQTTVRRRLAELRRAGVLYFDVDFAPALMGMRTTASLWLSVAPRHLAAAGAALAGHTEVSFAAATTGPSNLYVTVQCRNPHALYTYLTGPLAALPGVSAVETAPMMRTVKQSEIAIQPGKAGK
ncbi:Lrp/AsnC family transcriptional regulator [Amycolatopsis vastitatis]|uniref:AsnC family protein n=1 Tax=Amycolatopsis vastitatis TaxID=1905142 RepID=A0A229TAX7_9PSEU|nr:Lrp/AsnC family transcriptional regulator [Amycolatopsis vastitatis]OXM68407.1 AsnC family protein [Amycolatopsis vastitatis]